MVMALFLLAARFVLKSVQPDGLLQEKASTFLKSYFL